MKVIKILAMVVFIAAIFITGWISNSYFFQIQDNKVNQPQLNIPKIEFNEREKPSPQDWIKEDQIHVYSDRIVIDLKNAKWAKFTDTNSMDPVFDEGSNAIQLVPEKAEQLSSGDIITYQSSFLKDPVIHRIIKIGNDENGWYAIAKGDNNDAQDPEKIRFGQVKKVLVGVLY